MNTKILLLYSSILFKFTNCMTTPSTQFPPRLDEEQPSKSYQIIKIAEESGIKSSDYVYSPDFSQKLAFKQSDIIEGIDNYKKRYAKPESFYSWPNQIDKFLKGKHNAKKLDEAIRYLKKAKEPYIFNVHRRRITQYDFDMVEWSDRNDNLVISDFLGLYTETARSYLLFFMDWIPSYTVGNGTYSFEVNGERIEFKGKVLKQFNIFSFSKKYWGYAALFSTNNGKDKAPLLIWMSDPNDRENSQNGFYLVIPKDAQ